MKTIVTAKEVGKFLRLTESTIYNLTSEGDLPGFKIGHSWRFYMEDILETICQANRGKAESLSGPSSFLD
jgi:excisionase family DNA binding protein